MYIDNNAVIGAIAKGQTAGNPAHTFITGMWMIACSLSTTLWFERVPSQSNAADLPARAQLPELPIGSIAPYLSSGECIGYANRVFPPLF